MVLSKLITVKMCGNQTASTKNNYFSGISFVNLNFIENMS